MAAALPCAAMLLFVGSLGREAAAADNDRLVFRSKIKPDSTSYVSKGRIPFRVNLPGVWLPTANPSYNYLVLQTEAEPRKLVSVFDYGEGLFTARFYKTGFSEAQAVEEYYRQESGHQAKRLPDAKSQILARDVDGPVQPNLLWSIEARGVRVYFLTMSRDKFLISVTYQDTAPPFGSPEPLLNIFHQLQFPTVPELEDMLHAETDLKK